MRAGELINTSDSMFQRRSTDTDKLNRLQFKQVVMHFIYNFIEAKFLIYSNRNRNTNRIDCLFIFCLLCSIFRCWTVADYVKTRIDHRLGTLQ